MMGRPGLFRRFRVSISELMLLVAAVALGMRWPGLSVPVGLLFLYDLARRRAVLSRRTLVALGQVTLAVYLPPVLAFLGLHLWGSFGPAYERQYWSFVGRDYFLNLFVGDLSIVPAYVPASLIMRRGGIHWVDNLSVPLELCVATVVLAMSPLAMIVGLGMIAKRGLAWLIPCLVIAAGMSALSTLLLYLMSVAG
jgi:hypothetical protein